MTQFLSGLFQQAAGTRTYLMHVRDEKASGVNGGTNTTGYQTRVLNTVKTNEISGASLSANQITLPAGEYVIEAMAPLIATNNHKVKLRNITDSTDAIIGMQSYSSFSNVGTNSDHLFGKLTISSPKVFELWHYTSTQKTTNGYGAALSLEAEVYSEVKIWKTETSAVLPVYAPLLHVEDQKSSGTDGGTFTQDAWQTRILNTVMTNQIEGASLGSNQITLPAGRYLVEAEALAWAVRQHQTKLRNITDATDDILGMSQFSNNASAASNTSTMSGEITLAETKTFELQHRCSMTVVTYGFGNKVGYGVNEVYAVVKVWKIS